MGMAYFNAMHDVLLKSLKKFPEIDLKTRRRLSREFDLQMLNQGLFRFDISTAIFFYLAYISDGDIDGKIKKPIAKRALLTPDYEGLDITSLTEEQVSTILWSAVSFMRKMGKDTYEDFKKTLAEWDNSKLGEKNPFIPF